MWLNVVQAKLKSSQGWSAMFVDHARVFDARVFTELQMTHTHSRRSCNVKLQIMHLYGSLLLPTPLAGLGEYRGW